jgi:hypothetical protein
MQKGDKIMKAYKVEILVIDHDGLGPEGIKDVFENTKFPNWCMYPEVKNITERDIGEWTDCHPLNMHEEQDREYKRLFG